MVRRKSQSSQNEERWSYQGWRGYQNRVIVNIILFSYVLVKYLAMCTFNKYIKLHANLSELPKVNPLKKADVTRSFEQL